MWVTIFKRAQAHLFAHRRFFYIALQQELFYFHTLKMFQVLLRKGNFKREAAQNNAVKEPIISKLLYIDLRPGQTCHSKDGGNTYSIGVGELG